MSNVQLEEGYVNIPNELLDAVIKIPFDDEHYNIILVCWRYTYGFNHNGTELSVSFISKATGISKRYLWKKIKTLIDAKVLTVVKKSIFTTSRIIRFNENYEQWEYSTTVPHTLGR